MGDVVISAPQVIAAGNGYTVPAAQEITVRNVRASFNGAAAAGSYVPTLQIVGDSGIVVAEAPVGETLAAGASADVSWFPRVAAAAAGGPGGAGIQFDVDPQTGGLLDVETETGRFDLIQNAPAHDLNVVATTTDVLITGGKGVLIEGDGDDGVQLKTTGLGDMVFTAQGGSNVWVRLLGGASLRVTGLPTSSPGGAGYLWNNSGVLNIT
jgi:hypothetical protein